MGAVNLSKIKNRTFVFTDELLTSVLGSVYGITAFVFWGFRLKNLDNLLNRSTFGFWSRFYYIWPFGFLPFGFLLFNMTFCFLPFSITLRFLLYKLSVFGFNLWGHLRSVWGQKKTLKPNPLKAKVCKSLIDSPHPISSRKIKHSNKIKSNQTFKCHLEIAQLKLLFIVFLCFVSCINF